MSANNGEMVIKEQNVTVSELAEDGSTQIAVTFSTDDATGVEFIFRGMDGWRTAVHDITYINVTGYETVHTYDRSNRVVREEYYDLSGNPMLHAGAIMPRRWSTSGMVMLQESTTMGRMES